MGLMRRCIEDYHMIEAGDRIAVGVSGGKDSLTLLRLLAAIREYYPKPFTLEAFTINLGLPDMDYGPVADFCRSLEVPYTEIPTQIGPIIFDHRKEKNPCSMCAKMRRGALHAALVERGIHKVALGHHFDDAVETFLMSLLFEGRISCFQPVTYLDRTQVVHNTCPADKQTKRQEIKELVYQLSAVYPDLKTRVFGAMQRLPLPYWAPDGTPFQPKR